MSKTSVEFELLAPSREKPGGQQLQYEPAVQWPFPVRHYDQVKCEMQYRAFRDAYNRFETSTEISSGIYRTFPTLTDAELRMRWLSTYYTEFGEPSQQQIAAWAREASRDKQAGSLSLPDPRLLLSGVLFVLILLLLSR